MKHYVFVTLYGLFAKLSHDRPIFKRLFVYNELFSYDLFKVMTSLPHQPYIK